MNINLTCPINNLSYGIVSLNILRELDKQNHEITWFPIGGIDTDQSNFPLLQKCHYNTRQYDRFAHSLRIFHQFDLAQHVGKFKHVGFPIFELDRFTPIEKSHLKNQDKLFVCSQWAKTICEKALVSKPDIDVIPLGVDTSVFYPCKREKSIEGNPTIFLNVGKFEVRKGHQELIEAFDKAFEPTDNVMLILCPVNVCFQSAEKLKEYNEGWFNLYKSAKLFNKIQMVDRLPNQESLAKLMNQVDYGVFPTKAEGWCLPALELMGCGKYVIITKYSGQTEFCDEHNSRFIEIDETEDAYDGVFFKGQGQWAKFGEKQIEQLVETMRECHKFKQEHGVVESESGIKTAQKFSWENTVKTLVSSL